MPKKKTIKAVRKRFRVTKNKKVLATRSGRRHLLADKPSKRKRQRRNKMVLNRTNQERVRRALPYG